MTDFVTISLDSNRCDICEHETGEELVSCVVNDRCFREENDSDQNSLGNYKLAHRACLEKWESVMRNSLRPLGERPKRTWKDRIVEFVNSNGGKCEGRLIQTLASSKQSELNTESFKTTQSHCLGQFVDNKEFDSKKCSFLVDETYSVERIGNSRKVRVRSVDMDSGAESHDERAKTRRYGSSERFTPQQLEKLTVQELRDAVTSYKLQVKEVSYELVNELQERDSMLQQGETMQVTIAQLVNLQQQMRANSPQKAKLGTRNQNLQNTIGHRSFEPSSKER